MDIEFEKTDQNADLQNDKNSETISIPSFLNDSALIGSPPKLVYASWGTSKQRIGMNIFIKGMAKQVAI